MGRLTTIFCLTLFVFAVSAQKGSKKPSKTASKDDGKIVGGQTALISEVPYQVSLQTPRGQSFCGGSIISPEWILTAAHCTDGQSPSQIRVVAGTTHLDRVNQIRSVRSIINHPSYDERIVNNDISLIRLSSPLTLNSNVKPVKLGRKEFNPSNRLTIAGWGTIRSNGPASRQLLKVTVPGVTRESCKSTYGRRGMPITNNMICAGEAQGGKDSCQGDSGGPAVSVNDKNEVEQVGVVSFGIGCAERGIPGVYTNVANYVGWVERQTNLKL